LELLRLNEINRRQSRAVIGSIYIQVAQGAPGLLQLVREPVLQALTVEDMAASNDFPNDL